MEPFRTIFFDKALPDLASRLDEGGDVQLRDEHDATPLLTLMGIATMAGRHRVSTLFEMASLLVQRGADVDARDRVGHTALEQCSRLPDERDQLRFANLFLDVGAVVRLGDDEDLYYAIVNGTPALVGRLLDALPVGANVDEKAFAWAFVWKREDTLRTLIRRGHAPPANLDWMRYMNVALAEEVLRWRAAHLWRRARRVVRLGQILGYWQHVAAVPESKAATRALARCATTAGKA